MKDVDHHAFRASFTFFEVHFAIGRESESHQEECFNLSPSHGTILEPGDEEVIHLQPMRPRQITFISFFVFPHKYSIGFRYAILSQICCNGAAILMFPNQSHHNYSVEFI